jgi:CheY-like chemotaxis protein
MPVLDGWHFLEQLKAKHIPPIPIIVVTATVLTREWAEDHGCRGFLPKPIEPLAMLEEMVVTPCSFRPQGGEDGCSGQPIFPKN